MIDIFKQNEESQPVKKITGLPPIERQYKDIENNIKINQDLYKYNDMVFNELIHNKSSLFTATINDIWVPNHISYENEIPVVHSQGGYGTCGAHAGTTLIEWWMWKKTGIKYKFSWDEIMDITADINNLSYDNRKKDPGHAFPSEALFSAYEFNDNLRNHYWSDEKFSTTCDVFKQLIDRYYGKVDNSFIYPGRQGYVKIEGYKQGTPNIMRSQDMDYVRYILSVYGCTTWSYNPDPEIKKENGGHAVLLCKASDDSVWCRNSWGYKRPDHHTLSSLKTHLNMNYPGLDICFKPC